MTISSGDIAFTYSGGSINTESANSLGGAASVHSILNQRLFEDVSLAQARNGLTDYRCFYLNNDNLLEFLFNAQIYISSIEDGIDAQLGFQKVNEQQTITVSHANSITSGSFTLRYVEANGHQDFTVAWNSSLSTWTTNLQTAINAVLNLEDVTVMGTLSGTVVTFEINFDGSAGGRFHEVFQQISNNLLPSSTAVIAISISVNGGPINFVADEIDVSTTPPTNITFAATSSFVPYDLGDLQPLDSVPIWIKRIIPRNTKAIPNDGFTIALAGDPISFNSLSWKGWSTFSWEDNDVFAWA